MCFVDCGLKKKSRNQKSEKQSNLESKLLDTTSKCQIEQPNEPRQELHGEDAEITRTRRENLERFRREHGTALRESEGNW